MVNGIQKEIEEREQEEAEATANVFPKGNETDRIVDYTEHSVWCVYRSVL